MLSQTPNYRGYRFPAEIISYAVWLYYRFSLSFRDIEDLLAQRGIVRVQSNLDEVGVSSTDHRNTMLSLSAGE
jgi:transposase-like protein